MELKEEQEILATCIAKFAELDKKIYSIIEENKDTIKDDIANNNLGEIFEAAKELYCLQTITNCLMQRVMKRQTLITPGNNIPPGFPPL